MYESLSMLFVSLFNFVFLFFLSLADEIKLLNESIILSTLLCRAVATNNNNEKTVCCSPYFT